jgi:hypothetical protein
MADFARTLSRCALAYDWNAAFNQTVQLAVYQGYRSHNSKPPSIKSDLSTLLAVLFSALIAFSPCLQA